MSYYLGVDLGTSSLKIILGRDGKLLGSSNSSFTINSQKVGYSEENPNDWIRAFHEALADLIDEFPIIKTEDLVFSFSGQMHSLVLLDKNGNVLRPAILWNDNRTVEEVAFLKEHFNEHLLQVEKNIPLEGFTLPKILWIQKHEPSIWSQTWKFLLPKDYLIYYLSGKVMTEPSDAAGTILYDVEKQVWDELLLEKLGIDKDRCPDVFPSKEIVGEMKSEIKKKFNLSGKIKLVLGGADNACGSFGVIRNPDTEGLISVGTSGVVLIYEGEQSADNLGKYHYFNSVINKNYKMGVTLSAGYSLDWLKKIMAPNQNFNEFTRLAEKSFAGSQGLTFLPYLFGERSPYFDPNLSGCLIGIKAHHDRADIIRAVMEGIAFSLKNVFENLGVAETNSIDCFRVTGGVVKNPFWLQMFADIFNKKIEVLNFNEGPAYGALLCAATANNEMHKWKDANKVKKTYYPIKENMVMYKEAFDRFKLLSDGR